MIVLCVIRVGGGVRRETGEVFQERFRRSGGTDYGLVEMCEERFGFVASYAF